MDEVANKILTWKSGLLNVAGCILLTKVTLSAIRIHISIALCLGSHRDPLLQARVPLAEHAVYLGRPLQSGVARRVRAHSVWGARSARPTHHQLRFSPALGVT